MLCKHMNSVWSTSHVIIFIPRMSLVFHSQMLSSPRVLLLALGLTVLISASLAMSPEEVQYTAE